MIVEAGGLDKIEALQRHNNHDIYEKAIKILELHFEVEDDEDKDAACDCRPHPNCGGWTRWPPRRAVLALATCSPRT